MTSSLEVNEKLPFMAVMSCRKLLHASSLEETGIGSVLPDVGGVALLGRVNFSLVFRDIFAHLDVIAGSLGAAIGGWNRRHLMMA
jgi:hypothetical protein